MTLMVMRRLRGSIRWFFVPDSIVAEVAYTSTGRHRRASTGLGFLK